MYTASSGSPNKGNKTGRKYKRLGESRGVGGSLMKSIFGLGITSSTAPVTSVTASALRDTKTTLTPVTARLGLGQDEGVLKTGRSTISLLSPGGLQVGVVGGGDKVVANEGDLIAPLDLQMNPYGVVSTGNNTGILPPILRLYIVAVYCNSILHIYIY